MNACLAKRKRLARSSRFSAASGRFTEEGIRLNYFAGGFCKVSRERDRRMPDMFFITMRLLITAFLSQPVVCFPAQQSLAERDSEVSKLRSSITGLEVELQRKTVDLGAVQRQVWPSV